MLFVLMELLIKKSLDDLLYGKCYLIAEYPTWQEAVNSKEFKK